MTSTPPLPAEPSFLYLASQSPRRGQLLEQLGVPYRLLLADADEDAEALEAEQPGEHARDYVLRVVQAKAIAAATRRASRHLPSAAILCADTTISLDGAILGKPTDADDAARMLSRLSGRQHEVLTAVAVVPVAPRLPATASAPPSASAASTSLETGAITAMASTAAATAVLDIRTVLSTSVVTFRVLDDRDITRYIASGEPFGKAGGYGIQGRAAAFIAHLDGSYSGVMGLPLFETASLLRDAAPIAYDVALSHRDSTQ